MKKQSEKDMEEKNGLLPKVVLGIAVAAVVVAAGAGVKNYFSGEKKASQSSEIADSFSPIVNYVESDENDDSDGKVIEAISTLKFKELGTDETKFSDYSLYDYTEEENPVRYAVAEQDAVDINAQDPLDGMHLLTYANEDACDSYFYEDMIEIISEEYPDAIRSAKIDESGNWYTFQTSENMYGESHRYCFYIDGNSMLYAVTNAEKGVNPIAYLDQNGYADELGIGLPSGEVQDVTEEFVNDYNNR